MPLTMAEAFRPLLGRGRLEQPGWPRRSRQSTATSQGWMSAREVNRLTGWKGPVFERRYEMTVVTNEEAVRVER